jgi:RNA-binding protein 25
MKDDAASRIAAASKSNVSTPVAVPTVSAQAQEEKRQAVRKLIESIPTKKEDLFTFALDWSLLDSVCSGHCLSIEFNSILFHC